VNNAGYIKILFITFVFIVIIKTYFNLLYFIMKNLSLFLILSFCAFSLTAQIQITQDDMPYLDTFCVSITTIPEFDASLTGENYEWDYSFLEYQSQRMDTFTSVISTPYIYQLAYNNFLDQTHKANIAQHTGGETSIQNISITENYDYFKNSTSYLKVGSGSTINSVPTVMKYEDPEILYPEFPLAYQSSSSSFSKAGTDIPTIGYYGQTIKHQSIVDGYGQLTNPFGQFDVVRVKSVINIKDTIYYESYSFGFSFDRPEIVEYIWIGKNQGIPLMKITPSTASNSVEYKDSVRNTTIIKKLINNKNSILVYPTISDGNFFVNINLIKQNNVFINITDLSGKVTNLYNQRLLKGKNTLSFSLNRNKFSANIYLVNIIIENEIIVKKIILK